jgi:hypothetical protein
MATRCDPVRRAGSARLLAALVVVLIVPRLARSEVSFPVPTELGSGVSIKLYSPLSAVPHFGFLPVRVTLENQTPSDGTWQFRFNAGAPQSFPGVATSAFDLAVPSAQTREAWFYVPIAGPGVSVNPAALIGGSGAPPATLPNAPPPISGVYPNPNLPGVSYNITRNIASGAGGLTRTFTITQTGPAAALPPVPANRLPGNATTSLAANPDGSVTRTTVIPMAVGGGNSANIVANYSVSAMNTARQELEKANLQPAGIRLSSSVSLRPTGTTGAQEITVTLRQNGPAALLPLPPAASLPKGFTSVNVVPDPGTADTVTREFVYVETASALATASAASAARSRYSSPMEAQAEARRILAPTKLIDPQPGVTTTPTTPMIAAGGSPSPSSPSAAAHTVVLFEQKGPASALPAPPPASLPPGVRVTVYPDAGGAVTRIVSYFDPAVLTTLVAAAAANSPATGFSQNMALARLELLRLGLLRTQSGVVQGTATPRNSGGIAGGVPDMIVFSESGPANLLPNPPAFSLPTGIVCNITPGAIPGEVSRNFVVNIPGFLAAGAGTPPAPSRAGPRGGPSGAPTPASTMMNTPNMLGVEVSGPRLSRSSRTNFPNAVYATAMGPLATSPALEQVLRGKFAASGSRTPPNLTGFEPAQVPPDWRVWSSFNAVLLRGEDYEALDGARRAALRTWLTAGGLLFLSPETAGDARTHRVGAGRIELLPEPIADVNGVDIFARLQLVGLSPGMPNRDAAAFEPGTPMAETVKFVPLDTVWVSLLLRVFAALIGPVNFFWFAPATKRHRLFFTVPLISLGGALAVAGSSVLQDGWGGAGVRRALVVFAPGDSQAAIFQEQAARSGFLARREFPLEDGVLCSVLPVDGNIYTTAAGRFFVREKGKASGDWFGNRARQAHLLRSVVSTRARIELVGTAANGAPEIESTLTTELRNVRVRDADGRNWTAASVPTGRRVALLPENAAVTGPADPGANANGTPNFTALVREAVTLTEPWQWVATGAATDIAPIATLRGIRWQDDPVIYAGVAERPGAAGRSVPAVPTPKRGG